MRDAAAIRTGPALLVALVLSGCGAPGFGASGEIVYTGKVSYEYPFTGVTEVFLMDGDGSGQRQLTDLGDRTSPTRSWDGLANLEDPVLSPDGRRIAFVAQAERGRNRELYAMDADGGNKVRLTDNDGFDGDPAFSPDGRRIAFVSARDGSDDVYVMGADGSNPARLTTGAADVRDPAFSPDGRRIAFVGGPSGNLDVHVIDADGSNGTRLTDNDVDDWNPAFSPDGRRIAFVSLRRHGGTWNQDVYAVDADGRDEQRLTRHPRKDDDPTFSPDGRRIAFERFLFDIPSDPSDQGSQIFLMNAEGGDEVRLTGPSRFVFESYSPSFNAPSLRTAEPPPAASEPGTSPPPPGDGIVFSSNRDGNAEIYAMAPDGSGPVRLTNAPGSDTRPAVSPDGRRIAFVSNRDGNLELYAMDADGSNQTRLTSTAAIETAPAFSPDGRRIAFATNRDGDFEIHVMDADGSNRVRLTSSPGVDQDPAFGPDGRIAFAGVRGGDFEIYVMDGDGQNPRAVTDNAWPDTAPAFSPDGSRLAFRSEQSDLGDIHLIGADGAGETPLTTGPEFDLAPAFSPDGGRIAFTRVLLDPATETDNAEVFAIDADGRGQVNLTSHPANDSDPHWRVTRPARGARAAVAARADRVAGAPARPGRRCRARRFCAAATVRVSRRRAGRPAALTLRLQNRSPRRAATEAVWFERARLAVGSPRRAPKLTRSARLPRELLIAGEPYGSDRCRAEDGFRRCRAGRGRLLARLSGTGAGDGLKRGSFGIRRIVNVGGRRPLARYRVEGEACIDAGVPGAARQCSLFAANVRIARRGGVLKATIDAAHELESGAARVAVSIASARFRLNPRSRLLSGGARIKRPRAILRLPRRCGRLPVRIALRSAGAGTVAIRERIGVSVCR